MTSQILKFLLIATLASCSVGPDYKKESIASPATYKAVGLSSAPPGGNWWASFSDPTLTSLLTKAQQANPQARAALARLDQARAILGLKGADRLPALTTESLGVRQKDTRRDIFELPPSPYNKYRSALNLNWELDLWGRVRRSVAQQKALTQATAADYVAALLSTKAEVARDYLALRHLDSEISLLSNTIKLREENQKLIQVRVDAGTTTPIHPSIPPAPAAKPKPPAPNSIVSNCDAPNWKTPSPFSPDPILRHSRSPPPPRRARPQFPLVFLPTSSAAGPTSPPRNAVLPSPLKNAALSLRNACPTFLSPRLADSPP